MTRGALMTIPNTKQIAMFIHCGMCVKEFKDKDPATRGQSPQSYSRLSIGYTKLGFQVWCNRHDVNVMHIDFEGQQHPANTTRKGA